MNKSIFAFALVFSGPVVAEPVTIVALGDSLTQGYGLVETQGFVPQLQRWLDERDVQVRLINAGVSGDTTAGGLARVGWTLTPDVDGLIVALGGNDLLRGIAPDVARANIEGILSQAKSAGVDVLLVGMEAPGNYGPDYKQAFDALYPDLADQYGTLYLDSFFAGFPSRDPAEVVGFMQPDGIHPNAEGVALIADAFGPYVVQLAERGEN